MNSTIEMAEGALVPIRAWVWFEPMRRTWGYGRDPDEACSFLSRNPKVKSLIWCQRGLWDET